MSAEYRIYKRLTRDGADELIGTAPAGSTSIDLTGFGANEEAWIHVKAVNALGKADAEPVRLLLARFDAAGNFVVPAPNPPSDLELIPAKAGAVSARFAYVPNAQQEPPEQFHVYKTTGDTPFDFNTPAAVIPYTNRSSFSSDLGTFAHGTRVSVVVGAVAASGSEVRGPVAQAIADAQAPPAPTEMEVTVE